MPWPSFCSTKYKLKNQAGSLWYSEHIRLLMFPFLRHLLGSWSESLVEGSRNAHFLPWQPLVWFLKPCCRCQLKSYGMFWLRDFRIEVGQCKLWDNITSFLISFWKVQEPFSPPLPYILIHTWKTCSFLEKHVSNSYFTICQKNP